MWKFIVDVVHDFVSSLPPDVGRGFLHVSNVFLLIWAVNVMYLLCNNDCIVLGFQHLSELSVKVIISYLMV